MYKVLTFIACSTLTIVPVHAATPKVLDAPTIHTSSKTFVINVLSESGYFDTKIAPAPKPVDVATIDKYTGLKGSYDNHELAYKVKSTRNDLQEVTSINPNKLISFAEFQSDGNTVQVSGTLVVTQNQINPMIALLLANNFNVTGLHDHINHESPTILYLKFEAQGNEKDLSIAVNKLFNFLKQGGKSEEFPLALIDNDYTTLNTRLVDKFLKTSGQLENGIYHVNAKQSEKSIAKANSEILFSGSNDLAMVEGDLKLNQDQLQKILPIFNKAGISIIAITERVPVRYDRVVQIHYYGVGKITKLASGLQKALTVSEN